MTGGLRRGLAIAVLVAVVAGCGDGAKDSGAARTARPRPLEPRGIAPTQRVSGTYALNGRERRVRCDITPILITDKRPNPYAVVPRGRQQVQVDLRLADSGRDPLDPLIVRFSARDRGGERVAEAFRLPPTKLRPDDPQSPRRLSVGFMVRQGQRLARLEMRSTLEALPARVGWRLRP